MTGISPRSASSVVRAVEARMAGARRLQAEIRRLQALADEAERAARELATTSLGEEYGAMVIKLVEGTLPSDPAEHDPMLAAEYPVLPGEAFDGAKEPEPAAVAVSPAPAPVVQPRSAPVAPTGEKIQEAVPVAPVAPSSQHPSATQNASAPEQSAPIRSELFGVSFATAYREEAEAIVKEAGVAAAQRRRDNPYAQNRGKNAWRRQLFEAALLRFRPADPTPDLSVRAATPADEHETAGAESPAAVSPAASAAPDPLDDVSEDAESSLPVEAAEELHEAEADLLHDDLRDELEADRDPPRDPPLAEPAPPPPPARPIRPGFGASVPKPRNFTPPPGARPHPSQPRPVPSFMKRKET